MLNRRELLKTLTALSLPGAIPPAYSQTTYPSKAINMVCGFAAGSATDVVARVVGIKLSERLNQPVVVQNVTGAASTIAADFVVR